MFNIIINPETGRKININSTLGKKIIKKIQEQLKYKDHLELDSNIQDLLNLQSTLGNYLKIAKTHNIVFECIKNDLVKKTINFYSNYKKKSINTKFNYQDFNFTTIKFYISESLYTSFPELPMEELYQKLSIDISGRLDLEFEYLNYNSAYIE